MEQVVEGSSLRSGRKVVVLSTKRTQNSAIKGLKGMGYTDAYLLRFTVVRPGRRSGRLWHIVVPDCATLVEVTRDLKARIGTHEDYYEGIAEHLYIVAHMLRGIE